MPSPIAHSIVGLSFASVSKCGVARVFKNNTLNFLLICFVCAAPDLDIIPGIVVGLPALYHHGISHSFGFALLFGFILSSVIYVFNKKYYFSRALFFTALYSSHIILDLFCVDTGMINGYGMPLFFPFSSHRFSAQVILFSVGLMEDGYLRFDTVFKYDNLFPLLVELFISVCIWIFVIGLSYIISKKEVYES